MKEYKMLNVFKIFGYQGVQNHLMSEADFQARLNTTNNQILSDLENYRQEQLRLIDTEITEEKAKRLNEITQLAITCADEKGQYEHDYHYTMQIRGIELAKLEARIDALKEMEGNDARCYKEIISAKDNEIEYLRQTIARLISVNERAVTQNITINEQVEN